MKLNKLFAGVLAAAMMMSVGVSAMAATNSVVINGTTYTDAGEVTIYKSYKLIGEGISPKETFTLEYQSSSVLDGEATSAPALPSNPITGTEFAEGAATSAGAKQGITVQLPTFTEVGKYEYTFKEVTTNQTAGVSYYSGTITMVVTVVNGENGKVRIAGVHTEAKPADGQWVASGKKDTFENTYTANKLTVKKEVKGEMGSTNKEFLFTVTFAAPEGKSWTPNITTSSTKNDVIKTISTDKLTYTFELSDQGNITFENLPEGVTYKVVEDNYIEDGYSTSYSSNYNTTTGNTMTAEAATVIVTNTKGAGTVDTGVILDNAPYILMLAVVAGGAFFMVAKKRREE